MTDEQKKELERERIVLLELRDGVNAEALSWRESHIGQDEALEATKARLLATAQGNPDENEVTVADVELVSEPPPVMNKRPVVERAVRAEKLENAEQNE
jgi:hypothetical protein